MLEDVEAGARDTFFAQRRNQRFFIDHTAASDIDEVGMRAHRGDLFRADESARVRRRRQRDRDVIALGEEFGALRRSEPLRRNAAVRIADVGRIPAGSVRSAGLRLSASTVIPSAAPRRAVSRPIEP